MSESLKAAAYAAGLSEQDKRRIDNLSKALTVHKNLLAMPAEAANAVYNSLPQNQQQKQNVDNKNQGIDLNTRPQPDSIKKNVTWGENESVELTQNYADSNIESDLFKKLKKISGPSVIESAKISMNTTEEISVLKEDVQKINTKLEELDNNIKTILDILKNKN